MKPHERHLERARQALAKAQLDVEVLTEAVHEWEKAFLEWDMKAKPVLQVTPEEGSDNLDSRP